MFRLFRIALLIFAAIGVGSPAAAQLFETEAPYVYLIDAETGAVLFSKNADEPFPPASLAKLMTVEVAFNALKQDRLSLEDEFHISENAWRTGGAPSGTSTMFAAVNSSVPLTALLKGIIVQSANDGCIAIAEGVAGSEAAFARMMTDRARALGLEKSTFANSTGLPAEGQYVTAREMTQLALHLWREYPGYYAYFAEPEFEWNGILQRNRNPLLRLGIGADGLKTGYTEASGYAIVASVARGDRRLFATLSGLESEHERMEETQRMLDWGMRAFEKKRVFAAGEALGEARVYGGERSTVGLQANGPLSILVPVDEPESLSAHIIYEGPIAAPVEEGAELATLQIRMGDEISAEVSLYAAESVPIGTLRQRALDAAGELLVGWMR